MSLKLGELTQEKSFLSSQMALMWFLKDQQASAV